MSAAEYAKKSRRFDRLFDKWMCPNPSITADEMREMSALRDELTAYDEHIAFLNAVRLGDISPHS